MRVRGYMPHLSARLGLSEGRCGQLISYWCGSAAEEVKRFCLVARLPRNTKPRNVKGLEIPNL